MDRKTDKQLKEYVQFLKDSKQLDALSFEDPDHSQISKIMQKIKSEYLIVVSIYSNQKVQILATSLGNRKEAKAEWEQLKHEFGWVKS